LAAFQRAATTSAIVSSVSLGGCHSGQLALVVIIDLPLLNRIFLSDERRKPREFQKKLSLFSDEGPRQRQKSRYLVQ
jgi:hypothetical protein